MPPMPHHPGQMFMQGGIPPMHPGMQMPPGPGGSGGPYPMHPGMFPPPPGSGMMPPPPSLLHQAAPHMPMARVSLGNVFSYLYIVRQRI